MVEERIMREVYEEMQTPVKLGMILAQENVLIDCPNVFRADEDLWGMIYVKYESSKDGYETWYAESEDLIHWVERGIILGQNRTGWDALQADGSIALVNPIWGGDYKPAAYQGKYWMPYIGGSLPGYETDPLSIGMAVSQEGPKGPWKRAEVPFMGPGDPDARTFERETLYKSNILEDPQGLTGHRFVMFYNAKQQGVWIERIGMAVSDDMVHWSRYGEGPVIDNGIENEQNICGDPQLVLYKDIWVMHYFVYKNHRAFDTFACSKDLVNWTKWTGKPLIESSEPFDQTFAHKPCVIKHKGKVYHFYCAVNGEQRGIALAVSERGECL